MKKVIVFIIVITLVLAVMPAVIYAKGGPAQKATGDVSLIAANGKTGRYIELNAHEPKTEGDSAKGEVHWWRIEDGVRNDFYAYVTSVEITGNEAFIEGEVYESNFGNIDPGDTFEFAIWDKSTPGMGETQASSDKIYWNWTSGLSGQQTYYATSGNLVVHLNE